MIARAFPICLTVVVALASSRAPAAELTVVVDGLTGPGTVMAMVFADAESFTTQTHPLAAFAIQPNQGRVRVTVADLNPGTYAVAAYQDVNGNTQLDRNWLGVPTEPYGFSRDARPGLAAVGYSEAAVEVSPGGDVVPIHLR